MSLRATMVLDVVRMKMCAENGHEVPIMCRGVRVSVSYTYRPPDKDDDGDHGEIKLHGAYLPRPMFLTDESASIQTMHYTGLDLLPMLGERQREWLIDHLPRPV